MKRLLTILFCLFPVVLLAQDAAPVLSPDATNFLTGLLQTALVKYPVLTTIVTLVGSMRVWAKPVFSILHQIVDLTPTQADNDFMAKLLTFFQHNPVGRVLAYLLDWLASVKVNPPKGG
jgi:hypothetical protein